MHELGILRYIVRIVKEIAKKNKIRIIRYITLEVGNDSGVVPQYLKKLYPLLADTLPLLKNAELRIRMVCGRGLVVKDIGY